MLVRTLLDIYFIALADLQAGGTAASISRS